MSTDTLLGMIGTVLGVLGIITGYLFYLKGKKEKEPCFSLDNVNLIKGYSSVFTDLKIKYKQKEIENLTITKIVFWNNGTETIDKGDIDTAFPPMIVALEDTTMLDIKILKESNPANSFSTDLAENGKSALVLFDYLNNQDGAVIQVIHTGVSFVNLWITGEMKGVKEIKYKTKRPDVLSRVMRIFLYVYGVGTLVLVGADLHNSTFLQVKNDGFTWPTWFLVVLGLGILVAIIFDIRSSRNIGRIPRELSIFEKNNEDIRKK